MDLAATEFEGQERLRSACVACHRRKVRCVRVGDSCSSCLQSNIPCRYSLASSSSAVTTTDQRGQPLRKRRGPYKKGKTPREKELEAVVTSLTARCQSLERRVQNSAAIGIKSPAAGSSTDTWGNVVVAQQFSEALSVNSEPVQLLSRTDSSQHGPLAPTESYVSCRPFDKLQSSLSTEGPFPRPSRDEILQLWHVYMVRVEPLTKIVTSSSFADLLLMVQDDHVPTYDIRMLTLSVCLAAINALSEEEVIQRYHENKDSVSAKFLSLIQTMPAKPATPAQPSTRLLQALVLNAISLFRRNDARSVTFIEAFELALGVFGRVGIEASDTEASSAHDREVRRRCWWTLRKLNDQLILATGSERGELASISDVAVPLNINDIDLTLAMDEMPTARTGSTAMSFYLVNLKAIQLTAALKLLGGAGHPSKSIRSVQLRRRSLVENAVGEIEREFLRHCDTSRPLDWFLMLTTKAILNPIEIMMLDEGMEQPKCTGAVTQDSKEDQKFLLRLDVVECWHLLKSNENLKSWRWFLDTLAQAFTVGDLQADLVKHPESAYSDRAYELIKLISHG